MTKHILIAAAYWLCGSVSVIGQSYPLDFNPLKPIAFEHPSGDQRLMLFVPERTLDDRVYTCQLFASTSNNAPVNNKVGLRVSGTEDKKVRTLCRASRADAAYWAVENNNECRVFRIQWDGSRMERTDSIAAGKNERLVIGVSNGRDACVIGYYQGKKNDEHLFVYTINAEGRLEKHDFAIPEAERDDFEHIFRRSFNAFSSNSFNRPLSVQYGMEHDPESAARHPKLFLEGTNLWLTYDTEQNGWNLLKLYTFDLSSNTLTLKKHGYDGNAPTQEGRGASYIYDGKIFHVFASSTNFKLAVRDLWTGNMLKLLEYGKSDTIEFANSPILMPGRGSLGIEKEYDTSKKFLRRYKAFHPSIQVRRVGNDFVLCIGGYEQVNTPPSARFGTIPGALPTYSGGTSYERACAFYSALNATNLTRSNTFYAKTLAAHYADMSQMFDGVTDEAILSFGGKHYLGRYLVGEKIYRLQEISTNQ